DRRSPRAGIGPDAVGKPSRRGARRPAGRSATACVPPVLRGKRAGVPHDRLGPPNRRGGAPDGTDAAATGKNLAGGGTAAGASGSRGERTDRITAARIFRCRSQSRRAKTTGGAAGPSQQPAGRTSSAAPPALPRSAAGI